MSDYSDPDRIVVVKDRVYNTVNMSANLCGRVDYLWYMELGAPSDYEISNVTAYQPNVTFKKVGHYKFTLRVTTTRLPGYECMPEIGEKYCWVTVVDAPQASFTMNGKKAEQIDIALGDVVNFEDKSANTPTSWNWNITGGNYQVVSGSLTSKSVGVKFLDGLTYNASLQVTNSQGGSSSSAQVNVIADRPIAKFLMNGSDADTIYIQPGDYVNFTSTSLNNPHTLVWGILQAGVNGAEYWYHTPLVRQFNIVGFYDVGLSVFNDYGSHYTRKYVVVRPPRPIVQDVVACQDSPQFQLSAMSIYSDRGTFAWYETETSTSYSFDRPIVNTSNIGVKEYYVSIWVGGAESERVKIKVTINEKPNEISDYQSEYHYYLYQAPISLSATGQNLKWYMPDGTSIAAAQVLPSTNTVGVTEYFVTQTNSSGCESEKVKVTVIVYPVLNVTQNKGYYSIQSAVNEANPNDIIRIGGTFAERVSINKALRIYGSNAGLAPWNWTKPATVIKPPTTDFTTNRHLFKIEVSDITIDGIRFDGVNNELTDATPRNINGQASRAGIGVLASTTSNLSVDIYNSEFLNLVAQGISLGNTASGGSVTVANNKFENITSTNNGTAYAIIVNNLGGWVEKNRIYQSDAGFLYQFTYTSTFNPLTVTENLVSIFRLGLRFSGFNNSSSTRLDISKNTITSADYRFWTADGLTLPTSPIISGIYLTNLFGTQPVLVKDNDISGVRNGVYAYGVYKFPNNLDRFLIEGGNLINNYIGVWIYNTGNTLVSTRAVISGTKVTNSQFIGIINENETSSGFTLSEMALRNGVVVNQTGAIPSLYNDAIQVFGTKAILIELNDTKISGAKQNFIRIVAPAMTGLTVDGKDVTYDGTVQGQTFNNYKPSATINLSLRNAVKARIYDGEDEGNTTAGIVILPSGTLPVSLTNFTADLKPNGTLLTWSTASELNNKHFVIEKSTDGTTFQIIANIEGKGTTSIKANYQFTDVNFFQSAYYRLTQVDLNGTKTVYHDLVRYVKGLGNEESVTVYPNPATERLFVNLGKTDGVSHIKLLDLQGKTIQTKTVEGGVIAFDVQYLPKGVYLVQYTDGNQAHTKKVVKQ